MSLQSIKTKLNSIRDLNILFAAIILLAAFIFLFSSGGFFIRRSKISDMTGLRALPPQAQQEAVAKIIQSGKLEDCAIAKGVIIDGADYELVCRDNIASELALSSLDLSFCNQISDRADSSQRQCQEAVLLGLMRKEKDIKVCDRGLDQEMIKICQSLYWQEQAVVSRGPQPCENLSTPKEQEYCRDRSLLSLLTQKQKVHCTEFSKPLQADCLTFQKIIAAKQSSISSCNAITVDELAMACRRLVGAKTK